MDYCSTMISEKPLVAYWLGKEQVVVFHQRLFGSVVEFDGGICYLQCELGPASDFEIVGEL